MSKKEIWAVIDVEDVARETSVDKVMNCYDFKMWEREEMRNLINTSFKNVNEFRWEYIRETLEITNKKYNDIGYMVLDLIEDIKMGFHRVPNNLILEDIENSEKLSDIYNNVAMMSFEYTPFRDYTTGRVKHIEIYYNDSALSIEDKGNEIEELLSFLEIDGLHLINHVAS